MKALLSLRAGGPETLVLSECPDPSPASGEVLIRVRACSVNYPDVLIIEDKYQLRPPRPFSPGCEVAGVVEAVGTGVADWRPGDRVIARTTYGGLAQRAAVPAHAVYRLPENRTFTEGAAFLVTYATTYHALVDRGGIAPGETMLVLGAAGGVGLAAVELGKALGATVIGAVSTEEKAGIARDAGADDVILYPRAPFDRETARRLSASFKACLGEGGADLIYDAVGGDYAEPALRAIAWGGRYLVIGFAAGIPHLPLNLLLLKNCDLRGVFWGEFSRRDPVSSRASVAKLMNIWAQDRVNPRITRTFALEDAPRAIAMLSGREALGKLVVEID